MICLLKCNTQIKHEITSPIKMNSFRKLIISLIEILNMRVLALALVFTVASLTIVNAATDKVVCYYGSWSNYRKSEGEAKVEDLNPNLCTHLIYGFVGINAAGDVTHLDSWLDLDLKALERFVALKKVNPNLKVLVAIGGWNQGAINFSNVAKNPALRAKFVQNALDFVNKYGFDGFDLDWEYPAQRDAEGSPEDKANFIELIKDLRAAFDKQKLLLTAAVGASKNHRDKSYDVPQMSKYLDFINIMAYDLHYFGDGMTGFNAPLYGSSFDKLPELNVNDVVKGWIADGGAPEKLVLGLGLYGRTFKLANPSNNNVGAATVGPAGKGDYTQEEGTLSYLEICKKIKFDKWQTQWDDKQKVPYAFHDDEWVGYDDVKSLDLKVDLAKEYKLGGVMVWSVEQDDIRNVCGEGEYPLLTAINKRIGTKSAPLQLSNRFSDLSEDDFVVPTRATINRGSTTQVPLVHREHKSQKTNSQQVSDCSSLGFASDSNCQYFYRCLSDGSKLRLECPAGTLFDKNIGTCNYEGSVSC